MRNRLIAFIITAVLAVSFAAIPGCAAHDADPGSLVRDCGIMHELEFGGVYIDITIDDFNALGAEYGDGVNVAFSNGYRLNDIPYYNGYYTPNGGPLVVAYPGYPYLKVCINNGDDLWAVAGLSENDTVSIEISHKSEFLPVQSARDIHYEDDPAKYPSETVFANFRNVAAGDIKGGVLFRSASPCDNQHGRAQYVDRLIGKAGVKYILNLADDEGKIMGYIGKDDFSSPYFLDLYASGKVKPIALNMNFTSEGFMAKVADGLTAMSAAEGPYLVHCTEGKDRTGFVCILLEALCGASYDEIADDYMITYDNYYKINDHADREKYDVIVKSVMDPMVEVFAGGGDVRTADLAGGAEDYLLKAGMDASDIDMLRSRLTERRNLMQMFS